MRKQFTIEVKQYHTCNIFWSILLSNAPGIGTKTFCFLSKDAERKAWLETRLYNTSGNSKFLIEDFFRNMNCYEVWVCILITNLYLAFKWTSKMDIGETFCYNILKMHCLKS